MSLSSKITLLFLLLVALMVACVYTHIDDFTPTTTETPTQKVEEVTFTTQNEETLEEKTIKEQTDNIQQQEEQDTQKIEESVAKENAQKEDETTKTVELKVTAQVQNEPAVEQEVKKEEPKIDNKTVQEEINAILKQRGIIFKRMSYSVTPESLETIKAVAEILKQHPELHFEVAGHTDAKGDESFNQMVSEQRAQSVMKTLIELGIGSNRLTAKGYGEAMPIVPNDAQGYSLTNRRVEINIVEE